MSFSQFSRSVTVNCVCYYFAVIVKGSKVLVRIIKNHTNVAGEVVKMETVAVDSVPVSDGEVEAAASTITASSKKPKKPTNEPPMAEVVAAVGDEDELEDDEMADCDDFFAEEEDEVDDVGDGEGDGELTLVDQGIDPNDEEWTPGQDSFPLAAPSKKKVKKTAVAVEKKKTPKAVSSGKESILFLFSRL